MKQKFVNATINDRRKGKESHAQTPQPHPARETPIVSEDKPVFPWLVPVKKAPEPKKVEPASDLEHMKKELLKAMREAEKKPRAVPKTKLIGMANATAQEESVRDYNDILAMLMGKK